MNLDDLRDRIQVALGAEDPAVREMAADVAKDLASLTARRVLGEDVEQELNHAKAAALNLSSAVQQRVAAEVSQWLQEAASTVVSVVLAAM